MKILFLQKRILLPPDTGWKIRTLNILRHLARWHEIVYLCNVAPGDTDYVVGMSQLGVRLETVSWKDSRRHSVGFYGKLLLNLLSPYPFNVAKDYDTKLRHRAIELLENERFDLVICDFVQMARNAIDLPGPPKVLFQHNVEAEIFQRQALHSRSWHVRQYLTHQWRKMRRFEAQAGCEFDAVIAVSERDQKVFQDQYGWGHVETIDTAVDLDYFQPTENREQAGRVVFVGSLDWQPNIDGICWFVKDVWHRIKRIHPSALLQIVGRKPSAAVRRLHAPHSVEIVGAVPDVRPYLAEAAVVIVPLRVGGGTRIKIFEAMAMGKPVVSTRLGAEGLNVVPGTHLEVFDSPDQFGSAVGNLLGDPHRRRQIGQCALELVKMKYSAVRIAEQFEEICTRTAKASAVRPLKRPERTVDQDRQPSTFIP